MALNAGAALELLKNMTDEELRRAVNVDLAVTRLGPSFGSEKGDRVNINFPLDPGHWRTKDGKILSVCDMETDHIQRCIGKIFRSKIGWRAEQLPGLLEELKKRGDDE